MAARDSFLNNFESLAVASEWTPMEEARPINVPIYSSSTFKLPTVARGEELSTGKVSETMVHSFYAKKKIVLLKLLRSFACFWLPFSAGGATVTRVHIGLGWGW